MSTPTTWLELATMIKDCNDITTSLNREMSHLRVDILALKRELAEVKAKIIFANKSDSDYIYDETTNKLYHKNKPVLSVDQIREEIMREMYPLVGNDASRWANFPGTWELANAAIRVFNRHNA